MADSTEANATLLRESIEAFNAGDLAKLRAVAAPDILIHYAELPEPLQGRETWQQGYELARRAFPDLTIRVDDLVAAGDRVALRLTLSGTHRASSRASRRPAARSPTSATSSTASQTAWSRRSGSAPTWRRSSAS